MKYLLVLVLGLVLGVLSNSAVVAEELMTSPIDGFEFGALGLQPNQLAVTASLSVIAATRAQSHESSSKH